MTRSLAVPLAFLLVSAAVEAQATHAIDKGSVLIGGSAGIGRTSGEGSNDASATSIYLNPRALFFVAPRVAVGGTLGFGHTSVDDASSTSMGIGPSFRYYLVPPSGTTLPYLGASAEIMRVSFDAPGPGSGNSSSTGSDLTAVAGINFMVARQVAITGEAYASRVRRGSGGNSASTTAFGLRFGVDAFLLR